MKVQFITSIPTTFPYYYTYSTTAGSRWSSQEREIEWTLLSYVIPFHWANNIDKIELGGGLQVCDNNKSAIAAYDRTNDRLFIVRMRDHSSPTSHYYLYGYMFYYHLRTNEFDSRDIQTTARSIVTASFEQEFPVWEYIPWTLFANYILPT